MAFAYYRSITIDAAQVPGASSLTAFPVMVSLSNATFKTVANSGHVQHASGYDIQFFSDSGLTTRLPAERESYSATAGDYIGWVKVTVSATSNTVIYVGYGDSGISTDPNSDATYGKTSVWTSDYKGVYHYPNGTTLSVTDSTTNANNCTNSGVTATTGKIDGGAAFNGSSQDMAIGTAITLSGEFTISTWINATTNAGNRFFLGHSSNDNKLGFQFASVFVRITNGGTVSNSELPPSTGSWYYYTLQRNSGSNVYLTVNGGSPTLLFTESGNSIWDVIGSSINFYYFNGLLDEVHVNNTFKSADWITTEYNNQNAPGSFYSLGSESSTGGGTTPKALTASSTATATCSRSVGRIRTLSGTGTASYLRSVGRIRPVSATGTASCLRRLNAALSAAATGTSAILKSLAKTLVTTSVGTFTFSRQIGRVITASASVTASFARHIARWFLAVSVNVTFFSRQVGRVMVAAPAVTATVDAVKSTLIILMASVVGTAYALRGVSRRMTASAAGAASYLRGVGRRMLAGASGGAVVGIVRGVLQVILTATATGAGVVVHILTSLLFGKVRKYRIAALVRRWTMASIRRHFAIAPINRWFLVKEDDGVISTVKDPLAKEDFRLSMTSRINGDTIYNATVSSSYGVTVGTPVVTGDDITVRVSGGTEGQTARFCVLAVLGTGQEIPVNVELEMRSE